MFSTIYAAYTELFLHLYDIWALSIAAITLAFTERLSSVIISDSQIRTGVNVNPQNRRFVPL